MSKVEADHLRKLVGLAKPHSDMASDNLLFLGEQFIAAHESVPGGLSIEVGSRRGGSAILMLNLIDSLYPADGDVGRPMLFTVDPYGDKPYKGGDFWLKGVYGEADYANLKYALVEFSTHAHFYLTAETFFSSLANKTYWRCSKEYPISNLAFVLLDGEHDARSIASELRYIWPLMASKGRILIDNVDKDSASIPAIDRFLGPGKIIKGPLSVSGAHQAVVIR